MSLCRKYSVLENDMSTTNYELCLRCVLVFHVDTLELKLGQCDLERRKYIYKWRGVQMHI